MAYNSQINFAIFGEYPSKYNSEKTLRIINNWRCKNDQYPTLLISDPASTYKLLKKLKAKKTFCKGR